MKTDIQIYQDVLAELAWDPRVDEKAIGVAASDGIVTLTGSVASFAEKLAAERAAERVIGVVAVANELNVVVPAKLARTDTDIARAVVDALAWDVQVPNEQIKSAVSNGWVTLEGEVGWRYERESAARAVRNLAGVRGVSNNISVKGHQVSPMDVERGIKQALERRADRTADHITIETNGSIVTLKGSVPSFGDRRAAEGAAWSAPGVSDVRDELSVVF